MPLRIPVPWTSRFMTEGSLVRRWITQASAGDTAAFEAIMRHYERLVLRTAQRLLWDSEDAKDAAQEVFLRLYKSIGKRDEAELTPWLYRTTVNLCLDVLRKRRGSGVDLGLHEPADVRLNPEQSLAQSQEQAMLQAAIRTLPPKQQAALVLRDLEGCTTAEVAAILESSEATVRSHISTARIRIRQFVEAARKERTL